MSNPRTFVLTVNRRLAVFDKAVARLDQQGIKWEPFYGMDNQQCRLNPVDTYDIDRVGEHIGPKHIAAQLSHYLMWKVMLYCPETMFWVLEYDALFVDGWETQYTSALKVLPPDWDIVFLGSCCTGGRWSRHIGNNLYEVKYPMCGHAMMYSRKALPVLLETQQKFWAPLDISLAQASFPKLRVYTILPRIVEQHDTPLPS